MNQVLTLDQGGRPSRWSSWEDAVVYKVKGLIAWGLGEELPYRGGTCRATGQETVVVVPSIIALTNEVFSGHIPLTNQNLFQRDNHTCCYCGGRFTRSNLTREHIIPVSRGGQDHWLNVCACCFYCNNTKGNKLPEEAGLQLLYVPYVPSKTESLILAGRNITGDQMTFLRDCLPKDSPFLQRSA